MLTVDAEIRDMELSADKRMLTVAAGNKVSFFDLTKMALVKSHKMPIHFREVSHFVFKYKDLFCLPSTSNAHILGQNCLLVYVCIQLISYSFLDLTFFENCNTCWG
mmetsp:Transcript_28640/g.52334  ORF Transcript_28640/g.52334 Transcript_28640/m.52334 type:complete len:106 (-) Transcript_28640:2093-2410(-)